MSKLASKLDQRGVAHLLLLVLLVVGLIAGVYLITKGPLNFFPKASLSKPVGPENSFTLVGPSGCTAGILCVFYGQHALEEKFDVKLYARSDIETANLFTAKMTFPKDLVEVTGVNTDGSFVNNWVENFYDNNTGEIDLTGGITDPGYQTQVGGPAALMATITFRTKTLGKGVVSFTDSSAIYSNRNNINILSITRPYDITVEVKPSPTPVPTPTGSRVFVTSTTYNGNLGGLAGADAKCQARADAANLGGAWKAWLSGAAGSPATRFIKDTARYKNMNGNTIANDWNDLTDQVLENSITVDENKTFQPIADPLSVWTNTWTTGYGYEIDSNLTCDDWTSGSSSIRGIGGASWKTDSNWTLVGTQIAPVTVTCDSLKRLYCFEQPSISPSSTPLPTCKPRPACLDAKPPCQMPEPVGGWCPTSGTKGDGNKDGKIDLMDMSIIHTDWKPDATSPKVIRSGIDMNNDGAINGFDFGMHRILLLQLGVIKNK